MSFFDLDPTASANLIDRARANPIDPETMKPGWFAGAWKAPVTGLASAVNDAALLAGDAATPFMRAAVRPVDELLGTKAEDWLVKEQQKAVDNIKEWAPDPRTTGVVGQVVHGLFNVVPEVVAGGPETAALLQGYKGMRGGMADGLDPGTAFTKGAIDGISTWVGLKIPMTLAPQLGAAANVGLGAAANVGTGMATRGATAELLRARGYGEMADQYKVMDSEAIAVDLLLGGGFGALAHYGPGVVARYGEWKAKDGVQIQPSDIDTALAMNNQIHMELDTAPGIPADPAARAAHAEAVNSAIESLLADRPVEAPPAVTESNFIENPSATATRLGVLGAVEEHLGPEWQQLKSELEARNLPGDTTLYQITSDMAPVRPTAEVRGIVDKARAEGWDADRILSELESLKGKLEDRNAAKAEAASGDRVRGELWVRERLTRAERNGEISPEGRRLAEWLLDKNPNLANDLGVSFSKTSTSGTAGAAGGYNPIERIVTIIKGRSNDETAAHEILHHSERMMPEEVQAGIQAAWRKEIKAVRDWATRTQNETMMRAVSDAINSALGDEQAFKRLAEMIANGEVDQRFYALANPSEFWAVNGSRILRERASESWVQRAKQWLVEFIEKVKDAFGLRSDAAVIRGLDSILKSDGEFVSPEMLAGRKIKALDVKTDAFKRWFGDSKVVDAEGKPLVVYHGSTTGGLSSATVQSTFFSDKPAVANGYALDLEAGRAGDQPVVNPVYLRIENPLVIDAQGEAWMRIPFEGRTETTDGLAAIAKKRGHDGVIIKNVDDSSTEEFTEPATVYITLGKAAQFKSAIGNNGQYDPTNPNILMQVTPEKRVQEMLRKSAEGENRVGVVVGGRPGEMGWSFANPEGTPPPIQHPVQRGPRLEKIGEQVRTILTASSFQKLAKEITGASKIKVSQIEGTWMGQAEPSFVIHGEGLTEQSASRLARLMGFAFAQDATVVTKHSPDLQEGVPTLYIGNGKVLQKSQLGVIIKAARERGIDLSTSADQKAIKFMHFGDEADLPGFVQSVSEIAAASEMPAPVAVRTQGELHDAANYLNGEIRTDGQGDGLLGSESERPALLGRVFDSLVVPYAKAVASEGYRFSPEQFARRFGLTEAERQILQEKLMPKEGMSRSTVPLMTGEEKLDVQPTTARGIDKKTGQPKLATNVTDVMWALQNRAARLGQIEPGDYSPKAMKAIAQAIADEVIYHVRHATKSAIGWYDAALKAAKAEYTKIFPELAADKDKEMLFDAVLGITSQGNDVYSNSLFAVRMFQLVKDGLMSIGEAVKRMEGTFGGQTRAIELNLLKLEHLLNTNGYDRMRGLFNKTMTVSEWNATLRKDPTLFGPDGKPLSVDGAATQKVTGWMVFGPKIGSFINNLHGDYSTLTADLWFSRTWNRLLGYMFQHSPELEAKQYQEFKDALLAEFNQSSDPKTQNGKPVMKNGKPVPWENGRDVTGMSREDFDALINDPNLMLEMAKQLYDKYSSGIDFDGKKGSGFSTKSDLRRRAKNWIESREDTVAAPRSDLERNFQQNTVELAQKMIQKLEGMRVEIADIQAALWFHEKELFGKMGASDKRSAPADYTDAAHAALKAYRGGELYYVKARSEYIGGDTGQYLGITIPTEDGTITPAVKALENADAEIAKAQQDSQGYEAAVACALRG